MQSVRYKMRSLQTTSDSVVAVETVLQLKIYDIFYYDVFKCDLIVVRRTSNAAILVKEKKKKKKRYIIAQDRVTSRGRIP